MNDHTAISPAILYWGTPVALITSENEDTTTNISAISSVFWLGDRCVMGFGAGSQTPQNILRSGQCTVNLPDDGMTGHVNALATTTGSKNPSPGKIDRGYRYEPNKWAVADLTPQPSEFVRPLRIQECPVQMECQLVDNYPLLKDVPTMSGFLVVIELKVLRTYVDNGLRMKGYKNRIDPDKWRPMIMSFQELYGLGSGKAGMSQLAKIDEEKYRPIALGTSNHS